MSSVQAHPRRCGENLIFQAEESPGGGSSPQVRGKRFIKEHRRAGMRLIPAGAGKTVSASMV